MKGNKRKQNGITLIALIITIIVMLILVGVTINVALNGGLFEQAQTAAGDTQKEVEKEELLSIAVAAFNEETRKVDQSKLQLGEKYTLLEDKTTEGKIVIKGQYETIWQIDVENIKVEEYSEDTDLDYIRKFFIGTDLETILGKAEVKNVEAYWDNGNIQYVKYANFDEMNNSGAPGELLVLYKENYYEIKYNSNAIAYDLYKWGTTMPVSVELGDGGYYGEYEPSLSNTSFQLPGEYKTTLLIGNGKYKVEDCQIELTLQDKYGTKEYIEGTDYSFNTSTGELVIFNLTESVAIRHNVNPK